MIEQGNPSLTGGIRDCWKKSFTLEDPRFMDYFFRNVFRPEYAYADVENGRVAGSVMRIPHAVIFNGRVLQESMISRACTLPDFRNQGIMHDLMETVIDACSHTELITLMPADQNKNGSQWGFEPVAWRTDYLLTREDVKRITNFGCAFEPSPLDMLRVYSAYIRRFNGFYARDLEYFVRYKKEINARGGKIVAYYDARNVIQGYAAILIRGREAVVEECVYLNSIALNKVLNAALQERSSVHLHTSKAENLSSLFPNAAHEDYPSTLARLNDPELFSRLFNADVKTVQDAFALSRKPLNLSESM